MLIGALAAVPAWAQAPDQPTPQRPGPGNRAGIRMPGNGPGAGTRSQPGAPPLPAAPGGAAPTVSAIPPETTATPNAPATNSLSVVEMEGGDRLIPMEFYDLNLTHLLRILSLAAKITIMQDQGLDNVKVTIIAPEKTVSLDVAFQILASILQARDYTLIKVGPSLYRTELITKAVREGALGIRVGTDFNELPLSAMLVTQIIPLTNLSAQEVAQQINPFLSTGLVAVPLPATNSIIVTDTMANVNKVLQLIQHLEGSFRKGSIIIPCRYRDASEIAGVVQGLGRSAGVQAARAERDALAHLERAVVAGQPGGGAPPGRFRAHRYHLLRRGVHLPRSPDELALRPGDPAPLPADPVPRGPAGQADRLD